MEKQGKGMKRLEISAKIVKSVGGRPLSFSET